MDFHRSYGLLVNTLNDPEYPTYCGKPISPETNTLISPFLSGIALPKYFFKFYVELLKNIFRLSTEISLYYQQENGYNEEQNAIKMLENFLTLLFQPYIIKDAPLTMANLTLDGSTPISRFAFHYHNAFQSSPGAFSSEALHLFASAFTKVATKNYEAIKNIPAAPQELENESDIPTFSPPARFNIKSTVTEVPLEFSDVFYNDTATFDYKNLSCALYSICQYCNFSFDKDGTLNLSFTDKDGFLFNKILIKCISVIGKKLIMETINTYTSSVHIKLKPFDENELSSNDYEKYKKRLQKNPHGNPWEYLLTYETSCLLQSLFLIAAEMLNTYVVSICKYPGCRKPLFYKLTHPKSCCCHKHADNYSKLKKETLLNCVIAKHSYFSGFLSKPILENFQFRYLHQKPTKHGYGFWWHFKNLHFSISALPGNCHMPNDYVFPKIIPSHSPTFHNGNTT
ncbi:MAG: hypothetical protein HFH51_10870 [Lachnospiraceae bacterium]|nr:hypothetical protein [Lachnospiraceae bacterium]